MKHCFKQIVEWTRPLNPELARDIEYNSFQLDEPEEQLECFCFLTSPSSILPNPEKWAPALFQYLYTTLQPHFERDLEGGKAYLAGSYFI